MDRLGRAFAGNVEGLVTLLHISAADVVMHLGNEVGNHSVFSINTNHKAIEA